MNFLDTFDITTSPDHNPTSSSRTTAAAESPSLNEEVNQVVGQLSRFWGGFVRQSQTAIESARKDFGDAVVQAQKELNRFTGETTTEQPIENEKVSLLTASEASITGEASTNKTDVDREALLPETSIEGTQSSVEDTTTPYQSFFSRLQASLPPSIVSSVQRNLPTSIDMDSLNLIRDTWTSELQRVQGVTLAQAEEYVHRSEAILRDTIREASEVLKDAVRVLPPEGYSPAGAVWDGTDVWMFSDIHYDEPGKGKARAVDGLSDDSKTLRDVQRSAATRAEAMLKQLRHDPEVIKRDPEADDGAAFKEWLSTAGWPMDDKITKALSDPADGSALQLTHDSLVPTEIPSDIFWKRYFFRVHQVEQAEIRRQALLARVDQDEDFSWEDDEESAAAPPAADSTLSTSQSTLVLPNANVASNVDSKLSSPAETPRLSSDDGSYDVVSSMGASSVASDNAHPVVEVSTSQPVKTDKVDEDEESDWE